MARILPTPVSRCRMCTSCRVQLLEISQYLENYLWPHFEAGMEGAAAYEHLMSMVVMVNQKFREQVPGWACFLQQHKVRARGARVYASCKRVATSSSSAWEHCLVAVLRFALLTAVPFNLQENFPSFFQRVLALKLDPEAASRMRMHERVAHLVFIINAFQVRALPHARPRAAASCR